MSQWVQYTKANRFNDSYIKGFLDVSGGDLLLRHGDASMNQKLYVEGDASFNSNVDICGNFYAQYPDNSIPSSAVIGGVGSGFDNNSDLSLNANLSVSGDTSFNNVYVGGNVQIQGDFLPTTANSSDIGSAEKPFGSLYVSNNTIFFVGDNDENTGTLSLTDGTLGFKKRNEATATPFIRTTNNGRIGVGQGKTSENAEVELDVSGNMVVSNHAQISSLTLSGDASFNRHVYVDGVTTMNSTLVVDGDASLNHALSIDGDASLNRDVYIGGNNVVEGDLTIKGNLAVYQTTETMTINTTVNQYELIITEDLSLNGKLSVSSDTSFNRRVDICGNFYAQYPTNSIPTDAIDGIVGLDTESDISLNAALSVGGSSVLGSTLAVSQGASFASALDVSGATVLDSTLVVQGDASFNGRVDICGNFYAQYPTNSIPTDAIDGIVGLDTESDISLNAALSVGGSSVLGSTLAVSQGASFASTLDVSGATVLDSTLVVQGDASFNGRVDICGNFYAQYPTNSIPTDAIDGIVGLDTESDISLNAALSVGGSSVLGSTLAVSQGASFASALDVSGATVLDSTLVVQGEASLNNALSVDGVTTLNSTLFVDGDVSFNQSVYVNSGLTISGDILPNVGNTYSLGSAEKPFAGLYISNNTIHFAGSGSDSGALSFESGGLKIQGADEEVQELLSVSNNKVAIGKASVLANGNLDVSGTIVASGDVSLNNNLLVGGDLSLNGDLTIQGNLAVFQRTNTMTINTTVNDYEVIVTNDLSLNGDLLIDGDLSLNGRAYVSSDASFNGTMSVADATTLNSTLVVAQATNLNSTLDVAQATNLNSTLSVADATTLSSTLLTTGDASFNAGLYVNQATNLNSTLDVAQATNLNSTLDVAQATNLNSTLSVADATTLSSTLLTTGDASFNAGLYVNQATNLNSTLDVAQATNLNSTLDVAQATNLNSTLSVADATTLSSTLLTTGDASFNAGLYVNQATNLNSTLDVAQVTNLNSTLSVAHATTLSSTLLTTGDASFNAGLYVNQATNLNSTLDVAQVTNLNSTLSVADATTLSSTLLTTGDASFNAGLYVNQATNLNSTLDVAQVTNLNSTLSVADATTLSSTLLTTGDASFNAGLYVNQATNLNSTLSVAHATTLSSTLLTTGDASFNAGLYVNQATNLNSTLDVAQATNLNSTLDVAQATNLNSTLSVADATTLSSTLLTTGDASFNAGLYVNQATNLNSTLDVAQATNLNSTLSVADATTLSSTLLTTGDVSFNAGLYVNQATNLNSTLSVTDATTLSSTLVVEEDVSFNAGLSVEGDVSFNADLIVDGDVVIKGTLGVFQSTSTMTINTTVNTYEVIITNDLSLNGTLSMSGNADISGTLITIGDASFNSALSVNGDVSFNSGVYMNGATTMQDTLNVANATTLNSTLLTTGDASFNAGLYVNQATNLNSTLAVTHGASFASVLDVSGATVLDSTLVVDGDVSFNNHLFVGGDLSLNGGLSTEGSIQASYNTDTTHVFGKAQIGYIGHNGLFGVSHVSQGTSGYALLQNDDGLTYLNAASGQQVKFRINNIDKMIIDNNGRIGIGTTTPTHGLSCSTERAQPQGHAYGVHMGTANNLDYSQISLMAKNACEIDFGINSTRGRISYVVDSNNMNFATNGVTTDMTIDSVGNVGIGTTSPTALLHVNGSTILDSTLIVDGDVSMNNKLSVGADASFNGRVDICGNFYAQYPTNSIPSAAIDGTVGLDTESDISLNAALSVGQATTLNSTLVVQGDASFNGRVDICGNFYAQYPDNSIPQAAIIGDVGSGSGSSNTIEYVPLGGIIIWNNAASIPDGFSICDGSTVNGITTPDLTGKFVIGRDPNNSYLSSVDNSGGSFLVEDATLDDSYQRQFDDTNESTYILGGVPVTNTTYTTPYYVLVYIQRTSNVISDIEGSADASLNAALSVGQATTLNSTLVVQGDASFNGHVDICGNFYAQYPDSSIPSAAIDGTVGLDTESDISLNAALSVGQATTLNSTLVVQGDASFNGRVDICGNFYAQYPTNSIPSDAIIGDIGSGSGNTIEYVPLGGIIIWNNAASIPDGFSICDGSTVNGITTPNLTGKFVIGRDPNNSYLSSVDNSGGSFLVEDADLDDYHERQFDSTNDSTYLLGGVPVTNTTYTTPYYVLVYIQRTSNVISDIEGSADASLNAALSVGQATTLNSTLVVQGDASFNGHVDICGNFYAQYPTNSIPSAAIDGTVGLDTESDISLNAALSVGQATTLNSTLVVQGDATLSGNNTFAGTNTFTNSLPECSITPTSNNQLVNKSYVDSVSSSGGDVTLSGNNTFTGTENIFNNIIKVAHPASGTTKLSYFGDAVIGCKSTYGNQAYFGHYSQINTGTYGNYAIMQNSSGSTFVNAASNETIYFRINNSSKVTILSNGNVGFQTTTPHSPVQINTPHRGDGGTNSIGNLVVAGPITTASNDFTNSTAILRVVGNNATNSLQMGVGNGTYSYEPWIQGSYDNSTTSNNNHGPKRIRMNPLGENIVIHGTSGYSDDRVKINEQYITNATDTLMKLKPQTYTRYAIMDASGNIDYESWNTFESGLITQEVYYDAPELRHLVDIPDDADLSGNAIQTSEDPSVDPDYSTWGTSIASLNYTGIIPYLIKSNQEQQELINAEKEKTAALESKVTLLETKNATLHTQLVYLIARVTALENSST